MAYLLLFKVLTLLCFLFVVLPGSVIREPGKPRPQSRAEHRCDLQGDWVSAPEILKNRNRTCLPFERIVYYKDFDCPQPPCMLMDVFMPVMFQARESVDYRLNYSCDIANHAKLHYLALHLALVESCVL